VSGLAYAYSQKAANWLVNYAYLPSYGGMSYWAGAAVCGNPIDVGNVWCNANTTVNSITAREIMGDAVRGLMAAYQQAPSAGMQAVIDNWYAGMWGKPGTGAVIGTADGAYDNQFDATGCAVSGSYPVYSGCGGNGFYLTEGPPYSQKFFGQFFGISNLASWPVLRSGGVAPPANVQVYISGRIGDVAGAAKMQVIVTEPTGVTDAPVVCASSPCAVTVNQAAGNPMVQVQYLSTSGTVLHAGEPYIVTLH
jgi:hypothetical protein